MGGLCSIVGIVVVRDIMNLRFYTCLASNAGCVCFVDVLTIVLFSLSMLFIVCYL